MSRTRVLLSSVSLFAFTVAASSAFAADLPRRAVQMPVKAPEYVAPYYNWSGFYVGINGGGAFNGSGGGDGGGMVGGTVGFNWQWNQIVLGLEADADWADITRSSTDPITGITGNQRTDAFGTVRGRLGYAWNNVLLYGTGGLAWAHNKIDVPALGLSGDNTRTGYAVGAGLEYGFTPNWTAKIEYLYADLGHQNYFGTVPNQRQDYNIVRAGLNYKF